MLGFGFSVTCNQGRDRGEGVRVTGWVVWDKYEGGTTVNACVGVWGLGR